MSGYDSTNLWVKDRLEDLVKGVLARGASLSDFWANRRTYARILGMTLLTAIERSERLVKSMEARGYDGDITLYGDVSRPPASEVVIIGSCYSGVVIYALIVVYEVIPV